MWNWLVRLWRKIDGWMHSRVATPNPYRRSNSNVPQSRKGVLC